MDTFWFSPDDCGMAEPEKRPRLKIGAWIKRLGLKQADIAKEAGIGEPHLSLIIKGEKNPSLWVFLDIARAMGFDNPNDLFEEPPPLNISATDLAAISRMHRKPPK